MEHSLEKALDTLPANDFAGRGGIVVDNESTDATVHILRRYAQEYACLRMITKRSGSASSARNAGWMLLRGGSSCSWLPTTRWRQTLSARFEKRMRLTCLCQERVLCDACSLYGRSCLHSALQLGVLAARRLTDYAYFSTYVHIPEVRAIIDRVSLPKINRGGG